MKNKKVITGLLLSVAIALVGCGNSTPTNQNLVIDDSTTETSVVSNEVTYDEDVASAIAESQKNLPSQAKSADDINAWLIQLEKDCQSFGTNRAFDGYNGTFTATMLYNSYTVTFQTDVDEMEGLTAFRSEAEEFFNQLDDKYRNIIFYSTENDFYYELIHYDDRVDAYSSTTNAFPSDIFTEIGYNYDDYAEYSDETGYSGRIFYVQDKDGKNVGIAIMLNYNEEDDIAKQSALESEELTGNVDESLMPEDLPEDAVEESTEEVVEESAESDSSAEEVSNN